MSASLPLCLCFLHLRSRYCEWSLLVWGLEQGLCRKLWKRSNTYLAVLWKCQRILQTVPWWASSFLIFTFLCYVFLHQFMFLLFLKPSWYYHCNFVHLFIFSVKNFSRKLKINTKNKYMQNKDIPRNMSKIFQTVNWTVSVLKCVSSILFARAKSGFCEIMLLNYKNKTVTD